MLSEKKIFAGTVIVAGIVILISIAAFVGLIFLGFWLLGHPEAVGQFFGAIANGFNSAK